MNNREATDRFQLAKSLYAAKRYEEALRLLDDLNAEFPGKKNLMYPRALCLADMGRTGEALAICNQLIVYFGDPRAFELQNRLSAPPIVSTAFNLDDIRPQTDAGAEAFPVPPDIPKSSSKVFYIVMGIVAVLVIGILIGLPLLASLKGPRQATDDPKTASTTDAASASGESQPTQTSSTAQPAVYASTISWYRSYEQASSAAMDSDSPMLLFFTAAESEEARAIEDKVFTDSSIVTLVHQKGLLCTRLDFDPESDEVEWHEVESAPTTIVTDSYGAELFSKAGALNARELYEILVKMEDHAQEPTRTAKNHGPWPLITLILGGMFFSIWPLYLTLYIRGKLPHDEFLKDVFVVGIVAIGVNAIAGIVPCFGWLIAFFILKKVYEFEILEFIILAALEAVIGSIFTSILFALFGTDFFEQLPFFAYY